MSVNARVAPWNREEAAVDESVRRRLFTESRVMIAVCAVTSPTFPPDRVHPVDQVTAVLRGEIEMRVGGRLLRLSPGRSCVVPAGTPHSTRIREPGVAETLNIFPPS